MTEAPKFSADQVEQLLSTLAGIDFKQVLADFKSGKLELEIGDALLVAQVVAKDVGYFIPEAATAAQWIALFRAVVPVLWPAAVWVNAQLPPPDPLTEDEVSVWGFPMSNKGLFQMHAYPPPTPALQIVERAKQDNMPMLSGSPTRDPMPHLGTGSPNDPMPILDGKEPKK